MPAEDSVDPTMLEDVAARLARSSAAALEASHELLAHYADTGDTSTQRAVDTLIDHAAETLRALTDSLSDTSRSLQATAERASAVQPDTLRYVGPGRFSARSGRRDPFA